MFTMIRNKLKMSTPFLLVAALLAIGLGGGYIALAAPGSAPASAPQAAVLPAATCTLNGATRACDLWAKTGTIDLPGNPGLPIWGYAETATSAAQSPGPTLIVNQGETISITLHNTLGATTALYFPGQSVAPDLVGAAAGATKTYIFVATNPGTYLYEAGLISNAQHQVAMGLYGALIVRPMTVTQAYDDVSTAFDDEALLVLSEIDPALNTSLDPASFDMRDFAPKYWLINGLAYPETDPIDIASPAAGRKLLLRYVNAGLAHHSMGTLGLSQDVVAADGNLLPYSYQVASASIGAGNTSDRIVTLPASADAPGGANYALYDTSLLLHNNGAAGYGGMLTFVRVTDGAPPATGPTVDAVALAPNPTDGSEDVMVSATINSSLAITGAEYFIGVPGAGGAGVAMSPADGAFDSAMEVVTGTLTVADLTSLASGDHTIYVHGSDGVWGAFNFAVLSLDKLGPATSGVTLAPNPSDGSLDVFVSATGDDSASGNSDVAAAECFIGATGSDGAGTTMTINVAAPIASLDGVITPAMMGVLGEGAHVVSVHSMDAFGQWGDYATATLEIDLSGPTTSNVVAAPNPNNGALPYNPTRYAVRVDATLTDALAGIGGGVNSTVERAEGFINTVGADGSGFPLTPVDGLFNEAVEDAYAYIPLTTINTLGVGTHQIWIHGQDASGNWGAAGSVDLVIEIDTPTVTGAAVTPITTDGTITVALSATATDATSDIAMAEWFAGADPGEGNGTPMTVSFNGLDWDLDATIDASGWAAGNYTLDVRARDAAGNWSLTDSASLTVTAGPPTVVELLYFSTAGSAAIPGVPGPNDDADVYLWDETLFSRVLDGTAEGGLSGNTDIDGLAFEGGLFYLSFNRNGGTNVPGVGVVQDEDVVTYNPGDFQWELFFTGVDVCDGMDASNGHDIDAFDVVNGVIYFSTEGDAIVSGTAGPYDDADIYSVGVAGCSRVFDASVGGLPGNANIDGLTVVDDDTFYMSFDQDGTSVPGLGIVQDESVVLYDAGAWSLYFDGTAQGLDASNSQDLDAIDVQ